MYVTTSVVTAPRHYFDEDLSACYLFLALFLLSRSFLSLRPNRRFHCACIWTRVSSSRRERTAEWVGSFRRRRGQGSGGGHQYSVHRGGFVPHHYESGTERSRTTTSTVDQDPDEKRPHRPGCVCCARDRTFASGRRHVIHRSGLRLDPLGPHGSHGHGRGPGHEY